MKKIFLCAAFALFSISLVNAQGVFKIGGTIGLPAADASDFSSFVIGVDAYYMFANIDSFINFGPTVGFRNFFGKDDYDDAQFLPLAGAARLKLFGVLNGGADIGYAVGINDGNDGGFYFRPVLGIDIADTIELNISYENISGDGFTVGNLNAGILFEL